jgi:hypothetical protein
VVDTDKPARWSEYLPLDQLVPARKNPKRHSKEVLAASVARWGFAEPGLIDERTGRLVAGHGRYETLRDLQRAGGEPPEGVMVDDAGKWLVPVGRGWSSADDDSADAYLIASNRTSEVGGWDDHELDKMLAELDGESTDALAGTGFSLEEPENKVPETVREDVSKVTKAHALISYPADMHDRVVVVLESLAALDDVEVRMATN